MTSVLGLALFVLVGSIGAMTVAARRNGADGRVLAFRGMAFFQLGGAMLITAIISSGVIRTTTQVILTAGAVYCLWLEYRVGRRASKHG